MRRIPTRSLSRHALLGCLGVHIVCFGSGARAQGPGEVLWRTRLDGPVTPIQFITRGPDGAIYTSNRGALYALNPDGTLRWARTDVAVGDGVAHSISIGADGTIYTGMGIVRDQYALVVALNPDGSTRWTYLPPDPAVLQTGPNVGPDGNIYATHEISASNSFGAFSLDPDGNLRWSTQGDPDFLTVQTSITTSDIEFGADRLHTGVVPARSGGTEVIYTFDLDGAQLWTTWGLQPHSRNFPVVDPFDRVILAWGQTGTRALSPDGQQEWFDLHPNGASVTLRPAVDSTGIIYSGDEYGVELWALNPDGSTRYVRQAAGLDYINRLGITPDDRVIVGGGSTGTEPTRWVRGYAAADGELLWQVDLPPENGLFQFVSSYEPAFSPDGRIVYVTTQFAGSLNAYGYVYAIGTQGGAPCAADFDGDGAVTVQDFLAYLAAYSAADPRADLNGDGGVNIQDFLAFLSAFGAGCI